MSADIDNFKFECRPIRKQYFKCVLDSCDSRCMTVVASGQKVGSSLIPSFEVEYI